MCWRNLPEGASGIGNADGVFPGPMLPRQALANSRNVPATNLLRAVGLEAAYGFFRDLGLHDLDAPADNFGLVDGDRLAPSQAWNGSSVHMARRRKTGCR